MPYDTIPTVETMTTRITESTKAGTTMTAKGKDAIKATVKKTAVGIQRSVKAGSNHVRRVARKAPPPPPEESTPEEEEQEDVDHNEPTGNLEDGQEKVRKVENAQATEKGCEESDIERLQ